MRNRIFFTWLLTIGVVYAIGVMPAHAAPATQPAKPLIAVFALHGEISEAPNGDDFPLFGPQPDSLKTLLNRMEKAGDDANVKAVVIVCDMPWMGYAQIEEIRQQIERLADKGKDVYGYGEAMLFPHYVMMSAAKRISSPPTGMIIATGLHGSQPYLRGLLDKIGVKPDFMTCGEYKSATEIFMREGPSPQADEMYNWLLDSMYQSSIDHIAGSRKVSADKAKQWVDAGLFTAEKAKEVGMIDAVEQRDQLGKMLKEKYGAEVRFDHKYGKKDQPQVDFSNPFAMFQILGEMFGGNRKPKSNKPAIGIVYVDGGIMLGRAEPSIFGSGGAHSDDVRKALDKAASDDSVKAVVLRINSPGGSATASEIILDATKRVKDRKPLIVSMGNVAGSGGYYVACGADTIFADDSTITGSIGVLTGKVVTTDMWKKIGINWKSYSRGANAGMLSTDAPFTEAERKQMREFMDDVYGLFKQHVTDIRGKKLKKPIDEIAGGRVYTGKQALDLGLIDKIGSMQDAVVFAAKEANIDDYDVRIVPEPKNFIEKIIEQSKGDEESGGYVSLSLAHKTTLVDLAKPYLAGLDPQRVRAVTEALEKLQMLDEDRVLMVMQEGSIR